MDANEMVLISVDDHVVEPPNVFEGRMPRKFVERAPKVVRMGKEDRWVFEDEVARYLGLNAVAGRPPEEYNHEPLTYEDMRPGTFDIHERIKDMNANGVLASLNFPTFCQFAGQLFSRQQDKELSIATVRAYNDWHIDEWAGTYPGRMIPCAVLPLWDPNLMAQEVHRLALKDCHAVAFSEAPHKLGYPSLHTDAWDPFFRACADTGTVVCTHLGSSSSLPETSPDAPPDASIALIGINCVFGASDLLYSGVFQRFPNLKWALSEGGIGWIPYFLERVDFVYTHHKAWTGTDFGGQLPSQVFLEHVYTCFISDDAGLELRKRLNIDKICWESDYPHSDSTWPKSPELLVQSMAGLSDEEINKVTHLNAMQAFNFSPFDHVSRVQATVGALRAIDPERDLVFSDGRRQSFQWKGSIGNRAQIDEHAR
jgi:predicted TIM-barrel fold metal-dependent hydrolase